MWHLLIMPCVTIEYHYKWIVIMDVGDQYFQKTNSPKNPCNVTCQILMDQWKMTSCWCYYDNYKLITLELHNNYSYMVVTELHELYMYTISHMVNCICHNSSNLFYNIHICRNTLSCKWSLQFKNTIAKLVTNTPFFHSLSICHLVYTKKIFPWKKKHEL
jgi:hypothetical protein